MDQDFKKIEINGVEYVRLNTIKPEVVCFTGKESVATRMIGKKAIVRSQNEGINVGTVVLADSTGVELSDCRRLWSHRPLDKALSWYEGVAVSGLSEDSVISGIVPRKVIIEEYSMTECNDEAFKLIMEKKTNAQD